MLKILTRSLSSVTYSSLCMPEDIAERGLEDVPNFYYRDDGLRLWDIISRYIWQFPFCSFLYKMEIYALFGLDCINLEALKFNEVKNTVCSIGGIRDLSFSLQHT